MSNERKAAMPPHCGNCIYHVWEEDSSKCHHPFKVDLEDLKDELYIQSGDYNFNALPSHVADNLIDDSIVDQEWQPYDNVCDNWQANDCLKKKKVIDAAEAEFIASVEELINAAKEGKK